MTVEIHELANGLRIAVEPMPGLHSAAVGVFLTAGGRHERAEQNGIAHFLEHMAFKGTPTRTRAAIAEEIEDVGGYINAYTGKEMTAYYARVLAADVPPRARHPRRHRAEPAVRGARHRGRARGDPAGDRPGARHAGRHHLRLAAGGRPSPTSRSGAPSSGRPSGCSASAAPISPASSPSTTGPDRIIVAAAGAVDPDRHRRRRRAAVRRPRRAGRGPPVAAARFTGGERREARDLEQVHVALAFEAPGVRDDDAYAAQIYATALGGGMSSRLFQELRERRGLCYTIFAQAGAYEDTGLITLYAGTGADQIRELAELTMDELRRAADGLSRRRARAGAGAAEGRAADGARERLGAGRAAGADAERLGPGARRSRRRSPGSTRSRPSALRAFAEGARRRGPSRRWRCSGRSATRPAGTSWRGGWRPEPRRAELPPQRRARDRDARGCVCACRRWATTPPGRSCGGRARLPAAVGADLVARPPVAHGVPQPRLLGLAGARGGQGAAAVPDPARGRAAARGDHPRQHPPRTVAVGPGRLLDRPEFARQGLMTEALAAVVAARLRGARPRAGSRPPACRRTPPRGRCSTARGFDHEGVARGYLQIDGRWRDHVLYANLRRPSRRRGGDAVTGAATRPGPPCSSGWPRRSGPTRCAPPRAALPRGAARPLRRAGRGGAAAADRPPRWRDAVRALRRGAGRASCPMPAAPASSAVRCSATVRCRSSSRSSG